jgi:hypothetical protein
MSDFFDSEWPITASTRRGDTQWTYVDERWLSSGEYPTRLMYGHGLHSNEGIAFESTDTVEQNPLLYEAIIAQQIGE